MEDFLQKAGDYSVETVVLLIKTWQPKQMIRRFFRKSPVFIGCLFELYEILHDCSEKRVRREGKMRFGFCESYRFYSFSSLNRMNSFVFSRGKKDELKPK